MRLASRLASAALLATLASTFAFAQNAPSANPPIGIAGAYNSAPPTCTSGQACWLQTDVNGKLLSTASVSVSSFAPNGSYGTLTATASTSASTALPTGTTVRITNTSLTGAVVSCTFATGAATGLVSNLIIAPLSSVSRVVGSYDHIACIDQTGSTGSNVVVLEGGSGLGNDSGGGGGGSSGGVVDEAAFTYGSSSYSPIGGVYNASITSLTSGQGGAVALTAARSMHTLEDNSAATLAALQGATPSGTNVIGKVGIDQTTPGTTNAVQQIPGTSDGLSVYFVQPAASDNHANIKNGAGQVYKISVTNNSATVNYIRLYNAATGFNGCNSATNLVYENAIPANTSAAGILDQWPTGMTFSTGISICVTSGYATNDTTNATASAMNVNIGYK